MTAASASVRFGADGVAEVESYVRLTGHTLHPVLHLRRRRADLGDARTRTSTSRSPCPAGRGDRRRRDVGRLLAEAVGRYVAELERRGPRPPDRRRPDGRRAGGVMALS